jgi:DNA polymerase-3 subunit alpha
MLKIVRYSDEGNWGTVGQFFSVRPEFGGLRVQQYSKLYPPQQALATYAATGNWEQFRAECRPYLMGLRSAIAKLVEDINSYRYDIPAVFLVSDEEYEKSYEWLIEQFLIKGFKFEGKEYRVDRELVKVLVSSTQKESDASCVKELDKKEAPVVDEVAERVVTSPQECNLSDSFVNLHLHSNYSDGLPSPEEIVQAAIAAGQPAVALTDHGTMMGIPDLYQACKKFGVKFIAGNECYLEHPLSSLLQTKQANAELQGDYKHNGRFHQIVMAKSLEGYKNLSRLTTWSEIHNKKQGGGRKPYPLITLEKLEEFKEGLIVTSGCIGSLVPQLIVNDELERARELLEWYQKTFGDDFYVELQDHDSLPIYKKLNYALVELGQELGCKFVITADSHYLKDCHYEVHSILYCIKYGKTLSQLESDSFRYDRDLVFGKSSELAQRFEYLPQELVNAALANTVKLADSVSEYDLFRDPTTPEFEVPPGHSYESWFTHICEQGLRERFKGEEVPQNYKDRLAEELRVINSMGFASYFLVVADYIRHANEQGIRVGVGRGSAAGSLAAYATKITGIDPIHYGLSFARFLNEGRREMPDIDTDFHPDGRAEMIRYVTEKYGSKRVAQICTYGRLKSRAAIKGVARALQIPPKEADEVSKMIPVSRGNPTKLTKMIAEDSPVPEFRDRYCSDPSFKRWVDLAVQVEGCLSSTGVHAAGVVIAGSDIEEMIPLMLNEDGTVTTQYEMGMVGNFGFLKMDFLGLINLAILDEAVANIKQNRGVTVDVDNLPMDDATTYALFSRGETTDIFQFGSSGMQSILKQLQPTSVEDLAVVNALYRPGTLDAKMIPRYIARKHGKEEVEYDFPELQEALQDTYGILVYQESVMKTSQVIAGFSETRADQLRSVVGKKKMDKMPKEKADFIEGGKALGFDEQRLNELFAKIETFGFYGFNRSHAIAYAYTAYQCAYLKANYPAEYIAALLSCTDVKKARQFLQIARQSGVQILPPDINVSGENFTPSGDNQVFFGLRLIRDLGDAAIQSILEARQHCEFQSLVDIYLRTKVNTRGLTALVYAGALDSLCGKRKQLIESIGLLKDWKTKFDGRDAAIARTTESLEKRYAKLGLERNYQALEIWLGENEPLNKTKTADVEFIVRKEAELAEIYNREHFYMAEVEVDFTTEEKLRKELEFLGFFITCNPVEELPQYDSFPLATEDEEMPTKEFIKVSCSIVSKTHKIAKSSGNPRYELILEDHNGTTVQAIAYHSALSKPEVLEAIENKLAFVGKFRVNQGDEEGDLQFILNNVG